MTTLDPPDPRTVPSLDPAVSRVPAPAGFAGIDVALPFAVDPRALAFARRLVEQHPRWTEAVAAELTARRGALTRAGAWAVVPEVVRVYLDAINATPRETILAGMAGLEPGVRHFVRRRRRGGQGGGDVLEFDQQVFEDETVDRIGARLTARVAEILDETAPAALARWVVEVAVAGVLTESSPPPVAGEPIDQDALVEAFARLVRDPDRGWDAHVDALFRAISRRLGLLVTRDLGLDDPERAGPGAPLEAIEVALGLRRAGPRSRHSRTCAGPGQPGQPGQPGR